MYYKICLQYVRTSNSKNVRHVRNNFQKHSNLVEWKFILKVLVVGENGKVPGTGPMRPYLLAYLMFIYSRTMIICNSRNCKVIIRSYFLDNNSCTFYYFDGLAVIIVTCKTKQVFATIFLLYCFYYYVLTSLVGTCVYVKQRTTILRCMTHFIDFIWNNRDEKMNFRIAHFVMLLSLS